MVEETIKAIKETEREAEQKIKAAEQEANAILEKAKQDADILKANKANEANGMADKAKETAKVRGDSLMAEALEKAKSEIIALKKSAAGKEKEAIQLIISQLV